MVAARECPTPPGGTDDGCVISGRLSRLAPNGAETVLIEDWCQQYPSHSTGSIEFGPDGQLYVLTDEDKSRILRIVPTVPEKS